MDKEWIDYLSKRMHDAVMARIPDVTLNGAADKRYPGNLNFSFAYVEVRGLMVVVVVLLVLFMVGAGGGPVVLVGVWCGCWACVVLARPRLYRHALQRQQCTLTTFAAGLVQNVYRLFCPCPVYPSLPPGTTFILLAN